MILLLTRLSDRAYKNLSPRTRALFGLGIMANAGVALYFADQIEAFFGMTPTPEEQGRLKRDLPRITVVDSDLKGK